MIQAREKISLPVAILSICRGRDGECRMSDDAGQAIMSIPSPRKWARPVITSPLPPTPFRPRESALTFPFCC
jgi:hypothetical protein